MPGKEDIENASLGALPESSGRGVGSESTASCQELEEPSDDRTVDVDATPPLGVKLTVYRLLNITTISSFCVAKGILTYKGLSTVPTTLDWVSGGVLAVVLYWISLYEGQNSKKWEWFFQVDLAPAIGYCTKRVTGGALWLLFFNPNLFFISLDASVSTMVGGHLNCFSHKSASAKVGIVLGTIVLVLGFQYCIGALTQQIRARAWASQWAIDLVNGYGPGATLAERYWWFGIVGTAVGLFCGIAIASLIVAMVYFIFLLMNLRCYTPP